MLIKNGAFFKHCKVFSYYFAGIFNVPLHDMGINPVHCLDI